jgi:D-alanyl-D-alanine carboxypeptidase
MRNVWAIFFVTLLTLLAPSLALAAPGPYLQAVYASRRDLQSYFDPKTFLARPGAKTAATSLTDWAAQYGWREDKKLAFYKPKTLVPTAKTDEPAPDVLARGYVVIDRASGLIVAEREADVARPIASLTKLMTADVVLARGVSPKRVQPIIIDDQVGGSALGVKPGTKLTVDDLFYAAFLPSANDAANALADATGLSRAKFVTAMNLRAATLGLPRTSFADPTGIDADNVSTPREFALLADAVFNYPSVRRYATTTQKTLKLLPSKKKITVKNSDFLLTKPQYDDVYVTAGKTGYLGPDTGWNLAVAMKSTKGAPHELMIVLFGEPMLKQSVADADALANWAWGHYKWK